jgi:hypothetical protein
MTKVLTVLEYQDDEILRNHEHYAQRYGYAHQWVETDFMAHEKLRTAFKYNYLLQQLKTCKEGELVMLINGHTAIFKPLSIVEAMEGLDRFVCYGPGSNDAPDAPYLPLNNLLIVRNTQANRDFLHDMLFALHGGLAVRPEHLNEYQWLEQFSILPTNATLLNTYMNVNWQIPNWFNANIFAVNLGMGTKYDNASNPKQDLSHDSNLEKVLLRQINDHFIAGKPMMQAPNYPAISDDTVSHFNPEAKIALVTLYTHHITTYARVSEHNVKRYCDRHGYAYHVYRAIPEELDPNINGTWVKSWLLKNNIANHDWIIWVDADVLFRNHIQKLEPLLEGRDLLFAKDLCAWPINAGIMGFRNTPANVELIDKIWQRMLEVNDKSTVYSDQGDQFHTINVLTENNILSEATVLNCLSINTAPPMSNTDSLLTHYVGWGEPYRSIYMAHDDAISQRRA